MKASTLRLLIVIFSALLLRPASAQEPIHECGKSLVEKNVHIKNYSRQSQLAWLKLIKQDNYEQAKQEGNAFIPGYFDGDYKSFDQKRRQLFKREAYSSDDFEAQQELSVETPREAFAVWIECIRINSSGLYVYAKDVDEDGATVIVQWKPAPGLSELNRVRVELKGAKKPNDLSATKSIQVGTQSFVLSRSASNGVIRGTVTGRAGNGSYSSGLYIPAKLAPPVIPPPPPVPPPPEKASPLYVGQTPNCNAAIVTNHQNHLNCVNTPLGYTIDAGSAAQQLLYLGVTPFKNAGVVTTNASYRGGATQAYGYTLRDDAKLPNSKPLYAVVGCGLNDGEVTTNPTHKNCRTVPVGWAYPW